MLRKNSKCGWRTSASRSSTWPDRAKAHKKEFMQKRPRICAACSRERTRWILGPCSGTSFFRLNDFCRGGRRADLKAVIAEDIGKKVSRADGRGRIDPGLGNGGEPEPLAIARR